MDHREIRRITGNTKRHYFAVLFIYLIINNMVMADGHKDHHLESRFRRSRFPSPLAVNNANSVSGADKPPTRPFLTSNGTRVQAQMGGTALLPCSVNRSGQEMVSWIRRKDFQLLTVGEERYSRDDRFQVKPFRHYGIWSLKIKAVRMEDAGIYECQISTHPPASVYVHLDVVVAAAEIQGAPDLHVQSGSTLQLFCHIKYATEKPTYVFWYHLNKMINYDTSGLSVSSSDDGGSVLTIDKVDKPLHSGNYTCAPSNAKVANISVHIFEGNQPAAMHQSNANTNSSYFFSSNLLCLILSLVLQQ